MEHDLDIRPGTPRTRKAMRVMAILFVVAVVALAALLPILRAQQQRDLDGVIERFQNNPAEGLGR